MRRQDISSHDIDYVDGQVLVLLEEEFQLPVSYWFGGMT